MAAELEYYKEQLEHGRHIEVQRSTVAGVAATISAAIIGKLLEKLSLTRDQFPYTVTLFVVGFIALILSAKLYERFKLHNEIAKLARNKLDPSLSQLRDQAQKTIKKKYPILFRIRLHVVWNCLFGSICILGLITSLLIMCRMH